MRIPVGSPDRHVHYGVRIEASRVLLAAEYGNAGHVIAPGAIPAAFLPRRSGRAAPMASKGRHGGGQRNENLS